MKRAEITKSNASVKIPGSRVVVAGGTQGIGAGVAERFAKAGSEVWIIGRNELKGNTVLSKLNQASQGASLDHKPEHYFFKADLSLISETKRVAEEIRTRAGSQGVDYLIMCQGGPPNGTFELSSEGNEKHYAVQVLSRFVLAYKLTVETVSQPVVRKGVMSIMAPAKNPMFGVPDFDDLDLMKANKEGKYGILAAVGRDSVVVNAFTKDLANRMPDLSFTHVFPGIVKTDFASNSQLPWYLRVMSSAGGFFLAHTPESYAEVPFYQLANPEGKALTKRGHYWSEMVEQVPIYESALESENMEKVWNHLTKKLE